MEPGRREEAEALLRQAMDAGDAALMDSLAYVLSKDPERLDEAEQLLGRALVICDM